MLRATEKYTKTDMVYLSKGSFWLFSGQTFSMICSFLLSIAFAHYLSQESYGVYKFIIALASMVGAFALTGLGNALIQATAVHKKNFLKDFFYLNVKGSILSFIIFLGIGLYYLLQGNSTLGFSMFLIAVCNPLITSASLYRNFLNGKKDFLKLNHLSNIETALTSIIIFFSIYLSESVLTLIISYFVSHAVISSVLFIYINRRFREDTADLEDPELIGMSKHWSFLKLLSIFATKIDELLIFHFLGAAQLAIYVFASAMPNQITGMFKHVYTLALPKFATQSTHVNIAAKTRKMLFLSIPLTVIYILLAPYLFSILFPQYTESILFSQILALVILFSGSGLNVAYIDGQREIKTKYKLSITGDILKIVFILVLLIPFGIWGIVIGKVAGKASGYLLSLYFAKKLEKQLTELKSS